MTAPPGRTGCRDASRHDGPIGVPVGDLVNRFYQELWNRWNDLAVEDILSPGFTFRGSLGQETSGRDGWRRYRDLVHLICAYIEQLSGPDKYGAAATA